MRVRALDKNHDWTFGQSRQNYLIDSAAIAQNVITRLQSFEGDWFLDLEHGLPWFDMMERNDIETRIKRQVLETEYVRYLTEFNLEHNAQTRKTKVSLTYVDVFGEENDISTDVLSISR